MSCIPFLARGASCPERPCYPKAPPPSGTGKNFRKGTGQNFRNPHLWVRQAEKDHGQRAGLTTSERERLKDLERENRELKRANEILRKASAYFAQAEVDRRPK